MNEAMNGIDPGLARVLDSFDVPPPSANFAARIADTASANARHTRAGGSEGTRSRVRRGQARPWRRALIGVLAVSLTGATAIAASMFDRIKVELPQVAHLFAGHPAQGDVVVHHPSARRIAAATVVAADRADAAPPAMALARPVTIAPAARTSVTKAPDIRSVAAGGERRASRRVTAAVRLETRVRVAFERHRDMPDVPLRPGAARLAELRTRGAAAVDKPLSPRQATVAAIAERGHRQLLDDAVPPAPAATSLAPDVPANALIKPGAVADRLHRLRDLRSLREMRARQILRRARNR